jgi:hypothetical protein
MAADYVIDAADLEKMGQDLRWHELSATDRA